MFFSLCITPVNPFNPCPHLLLILYIYSFISFLVFINFDIYLNTYDKCPDFFFVVFPNIFSFSPDTVGFVLSHSLSLILLFNGFHFRGNLFQGNPRNSYLCSWMPKYTLIEQVRLLKAFCQNTGYISGQGELFPVWGWQKFLVSWWRHAGSLALWMSVTRSAFWVHISLILMRALMSAASASAWAWAWAWAWALVVAYFLALSFSLSCTLSHTLSAVSHQLRQLSLASIPLRFICLLTVLWLITGSTMGVPPTPFHSPPPLASYYCCCLLLFAVCGCPFTSQVAAHNTKRNSLTKTIYLAVELVTDALRLQLQHHSALTPLFPNTPFQFHCQIWQRLPMAFGLGLGTDFLVSFDLLL